MSNIEERLNQIEDWTRNFLEDTFAELEKPGKAEEVLEFLENAIKFIDSMRGE